MLTFCFAGLARAASLQVSTVPQRFRQGQCFMIRAASDSDLQSINCAWLGKAYPLMRVGGAWEAFLPVPHNMRPGDYTFRLIAQTPDGAIMERQQRVHVLKKEFPLQRMTMKRSTLSLYTYKGVEEEYRAIRAALALETPDRMWEGRFEMPCEGRIRTAFGSRRIINRKETHTHRGVDISAPEGAPVVASNSGMVALAREDFRLHGKTVVIDHGQGLASLYLHLSAISVAEGQFVQKGDQIGQVGQTGASTGPHLHWGFYVHGTSVDPLFMLYLTKLPELGRVF